ncbi:hypothetical protein C2I36_08040 [Rhodobacteraceae bacterium WD3A24]|nr:hypothetical protein C2I36_08040 [Rhodobacteraceae bacterium WD3A24]
MFGIGARKGITMKAAQEREVRAMLRRSVWNKRLNRIARLCLGLAIGAAIGLGAAEASASWAAKAAALFEAPLAGSPY